MHIFLVIQILPVTEDPDSWHSKSRERIQGFIEAEDITGAEKKFGLKPDDNGEYLMNDGASLKLRKIERIEWLGFTSNIN